MATTGNPTDNNTPTPGINYLPIRPHYDLWKIALFLGVVLVVSQVIAINIAKNQ